MLCATCRGCEIHVNVSVTVYSTLAHCCAKMTAVWLITWP